MNKARVWHTTVDELLAIFHDALTALVPIAERARIPWKEGESYDEWDAIAKSLFENIVVTSLNFAAETKRAVALPPYDLVCRCYTDLDIIGVQCDGVELGVQPAFVGFVGSNADFPELLAIDTAAVNPLLRPAIRAPALECKFSFIPASDRSIKIEDLTVEL